MKRDDLPTTDIQELADVLGLDTVAALCRHAGGSLLYVPRWESVERRARNRQICAEAESGAGTAELSRRWGLAQRTIRDILGGEK